VAPVPQLTAGELATLMARGRRFIESGDFSSARPVYRRAAEAGYAEAALALGETYDPQTLSERGAVGMSANVEQARHWYERARDMGSLEAPTRLERLPRK
jgi:TPR repeat protein